MNILYAMLGGFALDWIFGDPAWLTHPVVIMGKAISALERALRERLPKTPRGERLGGLTLAIVLPVGTLLLTGGVCRVLGAVHPLLGFAVEQVLGALVNTAAIPIRLAHHLLAPCGEMLAGERRIFSFCHNFLLNSKGDGHSPSPASVLSFSSRPCSCASTSFILSGMGRPIWAAFSSRDRPSLDK